MGMCVCMNEYKTIDCMLVSVCEFTVYVCVSKRVRGHRLIWLGNGPVHVTIYISL